MPLSKSIKILSVVSVINQRRCNEALFVFIELKYKDYSILRYSLFQSDVNAMYMFSFRMFIIWINLVKKYIVMNCKKISALVFLRTGRLLFLHICLCMSISSYAIVVVNLKVPPHARIKLHIFMPYKPMLPI